MERQEANRIILKQISDMIDGEPDLRFHQILHILNIEVTKKVFDSAGFPTEEFDCKDLFNEESIDTLKRMQEKHA